MREHTHIRDPVQGTLSFTPTETRLMDTPAFQRLRGIRQLAIAHLVYPGAHHTRFEHSLGTLHLADAMARSLALEDDVRRRLRLAALLHDIGHIAFSHESEEVTAAKLGDHEQMGAKRIASPPLSDIISEEDDPRAVAAWAQGQSYGQIIASDVGADRIDYLLRDAHYTGVAYGVIDWPRILSTLAWHPGGLALHARGLEAAESLVLARFAMFQTVYLHHAVRIARLMLQQALRAALADSSFDWDAARQDGDAAMLARLGALPAALPWVSALEARRLYKRAAVVNWSALDSGQRQLVRSGELAARLSQAVGAPVLADPPSRLPVSVTIPVLTPEGPRPLARLSPIVASLQSAAEARATLLVCCEGKDLEKVARAARMELGN